MQIKIFFNCFPVLRKYWNSEKKKLVWCMRLKSSVLQVIEWKRWKQTWFLNIDCFHYQRLIFISLVWIKRDKIRNDSTGKHSCFLFKPSKFLTCFLLNEKQPQSDIFSDFCRLIDESGLLYLLRNLNHWIEYNSMRVDFPNASRFEEDICKLSSASNCCNLTANLQLRVTLMVKYCPWNFERCSCFEVLSNSSL